MTQEEKAKAYDEALERAKYIYNAPCKPVEAATIKETLTSIFPFLADELAVSEDERVRKTLIDYFDDLKNVGIRCDGLHPDVILAWLKKQGEQKSQRMISAEAKEAMYDKPSWSKEDERICRNIINDIVEDKSMCRFEILKEICDEKINWLGSLKKRVKGE